MIKRIFIFVCFVLFVSSTWASELCLHIDPKTLCTAIDRQGDYYYRSDVAVNCDGIEVWALGYCSNMSGTNGTVLENLPLAESQTDNRHCWCIMVWPIPSQWVWRAAYSKNGDCGQWCGRGCRNGFMFDNPEDITFREAVFNTLIK